MYLSQAEDLPKDPVMLLSIVNMKLRHALKTAGADGDLLEFGAFAEIEEAGGFVARTGRNVDGGYAGV